MSLCLHKGSVCVSRYDVESVPLPESTRSYKPVSYGQVIGFVHDLASQSIQADLMQEQYGLNKNGDQMFCALTFKTREDNGLSIGLRQSYNKTISLGIAIGARVFVCDNLVFAGSSFKYVRRNTVNVWDDFRAIAQTQINAALPAYEKINADMDILRQTECRTNRGYELIGLAQGHEVLTPTQACIAFRAWKKPEHAEFSDRTLWSLYNAFTESLKSSHTGSVITSHCAAHDFIMEMAA